MKPVLFKKGRFFLAVLFAIILFASSCKKVQEDIQQDILQQYFESNILNRDYRVKLATDNGIDITAQFDGYIFRLLKNTNYDGPMTGIKSGTTISGTWQSNEDYGKLIISLTQPSTPAELNFINRSWKFTKKAIPVMELAPYGTNEPIVLHMERL